MSTPRPDRICFLDNVRYWTVLVVVVIHVVMSQIRFDWGWPVEDPRRLATADWIGFVTDSFIMPVLFFLAGYFALPSLASKGPGRFLWSKVTRLLIPGALVVVFLNPVFRYVYHYTRGFDGEIARMSYWQYWPKFFDRVFAFAIWEPGTPWLQEYDPYHIWFITILFFFFAVTCCVAALLPRLASPAVDENSPSPTTGSLVRLLVLMTLLAWTSSRAIAVYWAVGWVSVGPFLNFFSTDIPFHALYFCTGAYAFRRRWFRSPDALGGAIYWLVPCVVLSALRCYLGNLQFEDPALETSDLFAAGVSLCRAFLCMSFLGFLLSFGRRWANSPSWFNRHMAANSYRTYLLHMTVVVLVQLALLQWTGLSGAAVLVLGLVFSLIASHAAAVIVGSLQKRVASMMTS